MFEVGSKIPLILLAAASLTCGNQAAQGQEQLTSGPTSDFALSLTNHSQLVSTQFPSRPSQIANFANISLPSVRDHIFAATNLAPKDSLKAVAVDTIRAKEKEINEIPNLHERVAEKFSAESILGYAAGLCTVLGAGFYIRQMLRNKEGTVLGWGLALANDTLVAGCALIMSTLDNFWLWGGMAAGNIVAFGVALKNCNKGSFSKLEKACAGICLAGWVGLGMTLNNPIYSAIASQVVVLATALVFFQHQYKNPESITKVGQGCYMLGVTLNLYAMSELSIGTLIPTIGAFVATGLCCTGLVVGLAREWFKRRQNIAPLKN